VYKFEWKFASEITRNIGGDAFTKMRVDKGGIKFVMGGANIMAPGLLNPGKKGFLKGNNDFLKGGEMDDVEAGKVVVRDLSMRFLLMGNFKTIHGEGKNYAMAVGVTRNSTKEMYLFPFYARNNFDSREMGKGQVIDVVHFLGDTLWQMRAPKATLSKEEK